MAVMGNQSIALLGDNSVNSDIIAAGAVGSSEAQDGFVVQLQQTDLNSQSSITTVIAADDTIPQNTEGDEVITVSITPKSATNILIIEYSVMVAPSGAVGMTGAVFKDSDANALSSRYQISSSSNYAETLQNSFKRTAGDTSSQTYKLRVGPTSGTVYINGQNTGRLFGDIPKSYLRVTEYKAS